MTDEKVSKKKICMVVQQRDVQGGIAAVIEGYYGSRLETDYHVQYVEGYRDGSKFQKIMKFILGYVSFCRIIRNDRPDIVHIHSSFGPSFTRKQFYINKAFREKVPVINHIHGADFTSFYETASEKKKQIIRECYSKCSRIVVLSEEWKELISKIVPKEQIRVIENYAMMQNLEEVSMRFETRYNNKQILFLGEIGRRKGAYDIPKIIDNVCNRIPDATFLIAGSGDVERVRSLVNPKYQRLVKFPGWLRGKEKEAALWNSTLFLLPSYNEGLPMSILDAMGYALPIISTNVGGIANLVYTDDGICNGQLFAPGDTEGMSEAIIYYLENKDAQLAAGNKSLEIINKKYSFTAHLNKLEKVYEELL